MKGGEAQEVFYPDTGRPFCIFCAGLTKTFLAQLERGNMGIGDDQSIIRETVGLRRNFHIQKGCQEVKKNANSIGMRSNAVPSYRKIVDIIPNASEFLAFFKQQLPLLSLRYILHETFEFYGQRSGGSGTLAEDHENQFHTDRPKRRRGLKNSGQKPSPLTDHYPIQ